MEAVFRQILEISITAGFAVIGVCLVRLLCKKAPKWIVVLLWGIVGLRLLLPFSIESVWSVLPSVSVPTYEAVSPETEQATPEWEAEPSGDTDMQGTPAPSIGEGTQTAVPTSPSVQASPTVSVWQVASGIWLFGVAAMLWYAAMTYIGVWRRVRTATKDETGVMRSEAVGSPFILGVLRPRIYVPYGMEGEQLEAVLAHENAHIKRFDHVIKPLGFLLLSVYWFQPLLWVAYVLLCRDIELACDERVVKTLGEEQRREYSMALVTSAVGRRRIAACPLAFGEVAVKERVKTVMNYKKPAFWIVIAAVVLSIVTAVCLLTDPISGTPYTTLEGATLKIECGWRNDSIKLPKGDDYIMQMEFDEIGKVFFTLEETDDRDMSATLTLSKELYHNGRAISKVKVSFNEDVVLHKTKDSDSTAVTLSIKMPSAASDHYWYTNEEDDTMTLSRYANGDTVLYLYYKHFWLTDSGSSATCLNRDMTYNWQKENNYYIEDYIDPPKTDVKCCAEGTYEWVENTLVLTENGGLTRYVFEVGEDGTLTHLKGKLSRHKKAQSPILANKLELKHEYDLEAVKGEGGYCRYTLTDGQGLYSFTGESEVFDLEVVSYDDGVVRIVRENPDRNVYREEHELIDLKSGESLGVCSYGASDYRALGVGYVPMVCEKDGKVLVMAQYSSWCGTAPPDNFLYEPEGLSSLRNGTVKAIIDGDEIVISYTDDNGKSHVIAEELAGEDGEGVPITRPLVTVTEYDAESKALTPVQTVYDGDNGVLTYNQISAAYVLVDGEYVDVLEFLEQDPLPLQRLTKLLQKAEINGEASYNGDMLLVFKNCDACHTVRSLAPFAGYFQITIGYPV